MKIYQKIKNKKKFTMLVSFKRNTKTDATSGTGPAKYSVTPERGVQKHLRGEFGNT
jgi:hypothetical protein